MYSVCFWFTFTIMNLCDILTAVLCALLHWVHVCALRCFLLSCGHFLKCLLLYYVLGLTKCTCVVFAALRVSVCECMCCLCYWTVSVTLLLALPYSVSLFDCVCSCASCIIVLRLQRYIGCIYASYKLLSELRVMFMLMFSVCCCIVVLCFLLYSVSYMHCHILAALVCYVCHAAVCAIDLHYSAVFFAVQMSYVMRNKSWVEIGRWDSEV